MQDVDGKDNTFAARLAVGAIRPVFHTAACLYLSLTFYWKPHSSPGWFYFDKTSLMSTKGSRDLLDQCQFDILLQEKLAGCLAAGAKNGNDMFPLKCISI